MTPEVQASVEFVQLPFEYETKRRKGIGLVAPFDFALDDECWRWLPKDVSLYVTRTARLENTAVTAELAEAVGDTKAVMPCVASLISSEPSSVAYACTSGSFVGGLAGETLLRKAMQQAGAKEAVTTSGALLQALKYLGLKKIAIATPYNEDLTRLLAEFLEAAGITVVKAGYLNSEQDIMHIGYDAVRNMAGIVDHPDAEAVFFSCTNLRTFDIITESEQKLGKAVLSANQVTIWAALQAAGIETPKIPQQLFRG